MNNEIKSLVARFQAATEERRKAEAANNAGHQAYEAAEKDRAAGEELYRQTLARIDDDPLESVKALSRIRKEIDDCVQIVERMRVIKETKSRSARARYMDCLGDEKAARTDLVKAISADATMDLDGKAIRQLVRGWVSMMLDANTCPPWHVYLHSVLPAPNDTEIVSILKDLAREFPFLDEAE